MIICHGNESSLRWIIKRYDINETDTYGNTPLHISVSQCTDHNSPIPCKWLCNNGADINIQNINGQTALHLACYSGFSNCIKDILGTGKCNIDIKDNNGKTAYDVLISAMNDKTNRKWEGDFNKSIDVMDQYKLNKNIMI